MSRIIPPLISNSPPPLDFTLDSDDEDEYQPPIADDSCSYDDFDIPLELPDIDALEMDINRNEKEDKDFHDKRKTEASSDFILPNIQEIVPNISNDVKDADSFDSEDLEIASIANNDDNLIPKITEPVKLDTPEYKRDRDINSPVETILNTELNDKTISDKELSSSEPNFESCSDNSQKEQENNGTSTNNETHNKSICDVEEINDDFGDFADFNNISSINFNASPAENDEQTDLHETSDITQKTVTDFLEVEAKIDLTKSSVGYIDVNSPQLPPDANISTQESSFFKLTTDNKEETEIQHIPDETLVQDHNFKLSTTDPNESESCSVKFEETEPIASKPSLFNSENHSVEAKPSSNSEFNFAESDDEESESCVETSVKFEETEPIASKPFLFNSENDSVQAKASSNSEVNEINKPQPIQSTFDEYNKKETEIHHIPDETVVQDHNFKLSTTDSEESESCVKTSVKFEETERIASKPFLFNSEKHSIEAKPSSNSEFNFAKSDDKESKTCVKFEETEPVASKLYLFNSENDSVQAKPSSNSEFNFAESDDEFGDFDSCTVAPVVTEEQVEQPLPDLRIDRNNVDGRSKEILEMMFPVDNLPDIDFIQGGTDEDPLFGQIRNLTETNALTYQWNKSHTQHKLLNVLNVDIRNILYGPGWNPSMPIFAANLSSAPLEPQKTSVPTITTSTSSNFNEESSGVTEAQFDWANSGLTNPLDAVQKDASLKDSSLGEPPKCFDTESVNSLQFTEVLSENIDDKAVTLPELDNFTDFQDAKTAQIEPIPSTSSSAMFPLRETYINSNEVHVENLDDSQIVQNINKNSTRVDVRNVNAAPDEDFTEFQASLPEITLVESKQSTNRSIEYKLAIENPIEPELLANAKQSSKVAPKVLQPTILQPLKVALNIAWPEPGITDDEIRKFEEYSYSKTEQRLPDKAAKAAKITKSSKTVPKQPSIEDEWSDFQDAAKELPLSIASLGKIAQHQALSQQRNTIPPNNAPNQNIWPNSYNHKDFFSPPANSINSGVKHTNNTSIRSQPPSRFDQLTMLQPVPQQIKATNDDEWSDFVCHQPISIPTSNRNLRQEDWTMNGPQFNSWSSTSVTPSSSNSTLQFNGFNSFGRSANLLNPTVKNAGSAQGKSKGNAQMLGVSSKRESVPSISALPDLDFATSASRYSSSRLQHQKK